VVLLDLVKGSTDWWDVWVRLKQCFELDRDIYGGCGCCDWGLVVVRAKVWDIYMSV
jgi:hypothetical protein